MSLLGDRLKRSRENSGYTQIEVSDKIGISNKALSRYENGSSFPDPDIISFLATLYHVTTDYLLGRFDNPKPAESNDNSNDVTLDDFQFALYGEAKDLSDEEKEEILNMIKYIKYKKSQK